MNDRGGETKGMAGEGSGRDLCTSRPLWARYKTLPVSTGRPCRTVIRRDDDNECVLPRVGTGVPSSRPYKSLIEEAGAPTVERPKGSPRLRRKMADVAHETMPPFRQPRIRNSGTGDEKIWSWQRRALPSTSMTCIFNIVDRLDVRPLLRPSEKWQRHGTGS